MVSGGVLGVGQAGSYFEHDRDYYTKNMTNRDRWHGNLAKSIGLEGELSEEQFKGMLAHMDESGKKTRAGIDRTFSAPKSVSLMMAKDEATRQEMIDLHQRAVSKALEQIEVELMQTRSNGKKLFSRNMIAAEFVHEMARPTEGNGNVPDLQLHSHCFIFNETFADGKMLACDFKKVMDATKELGLLYRRELARELQNSGYDLELTDSKNGFFELKGFDSITIVEHSNRRQEILKTAQDHGITDMQKANKFSRQTKNKSAVDIDKVLEETKKELFTSNKIEIEKKEIKKHGNERTFSDSRQPGRETNISSERGQSDIASLSGSVRKEFEEFANRPSLSELPSFGLDAQGRRADLLLPNGSINRLAKLQCEQVRSHYMQREERRERLERIDTITATTIKKLSAEKFAFSVPDCRQRVIAAGVLEGITREEAQSAMDRAQVVSLGHMKHNGKLGKNVYLTTEENMAKEHDNIERMIKGKGTITTNVMTMEESVKALAKAERVAREKGLESASFTITDRDGGSGEQATAVQHILTCQDKYVCVDGLAGTGKTTMMERLKWIADDKGIEIKGVCFTGKAADGLENESGIKSQTIHSFLNKLEKGKYNEPTKTDVLKKAAGELVIEALNNGHIPPNPVQQPERSRTENTKRAAREILAESLLHGNDLKEAKKEFHSEDRELYYKQENAHEKADQGGIKQEWNFDNVKKAQGREIWAVDEAGLVDTNLMDQLQRAAEARGAQVLLLGDPDQLPPVGAGEPMRNMEDAGMATARLTDIRRQKDATLLQAVKEAVKGDHLITFEKLDKVGNYREVSNKAERHEAIKHEMTDDVKLKDYNKNLLLVSTNADRKQYNREIRAVYVERGELEEGGKFTVTCHNGEKDTHESRNFVAGDRIIFTANDNQVNVKNGTMAQIERIEGDTIKARTDAGKTVSWDMKKYDSVDHAYAVTNYKAQGMTVQKSVVDMNTTGNPQSRNALYVDISRAKQEAVVFTDDKQKLEKQTREFASKVTSKDFAEKIETMRAQGGVKNNDRYHAPDQDRRQALDKALKQISEHTVKRPDNVVKAEKAKEQEIASLQSAKLEKEKAQTKTPQPKVVKVVERDTGYSR